MPDQKTKKRVKKATDDFFKNIPVPVPGSAKRLLDRVRQQITEATKRKKK